MYIPKAFAWQDQAALWRALEEQAFGMLVTGGQRGEPPLVSHLPFLPIPNEGRLLCHVARANPHWQGLGDGAPVRCVFSGPHGYVSPTWYRQPDCAVPTWNYVTVHAVGIARAVEDADWLVALVDQLSSTYERPNGWQFVQLAESLRRSLVNAIVGIEIDVDRLEGKRKLTQNRPETDQINVVEKLRASSRSGDLALADEMKSEQEKNA
ncbi:MAG: FMN-binding negative transcriptional regulator [Pseudomonadota bacterium]